MPLDPTISALLGAVIGAMAGVAGTIVTTIIIQRGETARHTRKLLIDTAIQNWIQLEKTADAIGKNTGVRPSSAPLDLYIIHAAKLLEVCDLSRISPESVTQLIKELSAVTSAATDAIQKKGDNQAA